MSTNFSIKRIYEPVSTSDGLRILVDRLWPRGIHKKAAAVDLWLKEIAPSPDLRAWFDHKPERFKEFSAKYTEELRNNAAVKQLTDEIIKHNTVTLLYAAHDKKNNHAVVLLDYLTDELSLEL